MASFIIGPSLSMLTILPVTPTTRVSGVDVGIFTQSLLHKGCENRPATLGLQHLPLTDDVPASGVQHHGFKAEGVVVGALPEVCPYIPDETLVELQHIPLLQQRSELIEVGVGVAK